MKDTYNYPEQAETSDCIYIIMVMILVYGNFIQFQQMIDTCLSVVVYMYLLKNRIIIHMISENYFTYTKYRRQKCATLYYYGITWFTSKNLTYVLSYWNFYKTPEDVKRFTVPVFFHCCHTFMYRYIDKSLFFVAEDTLPTLKSLQDQVMFATEEDGENYMSLTCHLLKYAVMEPGVPNPREVSVRSSM